MSEKRFPIMRGETFQRQGPKSIPWEMIEPYRANAQKFHQQSLEKLASRGGLSWSELACVLSGISHQKAFPNEETK